MKGTKKLSTSAVLLCRLYPTPQRLTLTEVGQGQRTWDLNYMCLNRWWSFVARLLPTFLDWFSSRIISPTKYIADDSGKKWPKLEDEVARWRLYQFLYHHWTTKVDKRGIQFSKTKPSIPNERERFTAKVSHLSCAFIYAACMIHVHSTIMTLIVA